MNAFWFSLFVNTSYFLADVFIKLGSLNQSASRLIYVRSIFTLAFATIWILFNQQNAGIPEIKEVFQLFGCGVLCAAGLFFYIKSLQHMHFVNASVIGISGAFIHYGIGAILFHEKVNNWFFLSAFLAVTGILAQWRKGENKRGLKEAVISSVCWGFGYSLLSIPLENCSAYWGTWVLEFTTFIFSGFYLLIFEPKFNFFKPNIWQWKLIMVAFFTILGSFLINLSYQRFSLNILGFMQLAFFPYSMLAGFFVFKEKLSKTEWIGISLIMFGLVLYYFTCT